MKRLLLIVCIIAIASATRAQDFSVYNKQYFRDGDKELPYRLLSPSIEPGKKYPLIIFLHGAFEKGNDNESQLNIGGRFFMRDSIRKNYPAYILFPQCPADDSWAYFENRLDFSTGLYADWNFPFRKTPTQVTGRLLKLVDTMLNNSSIDTSRIYIGGLSQGGMGVLDIIARKPNLFAAAFAVCGAGEPSTARLFAGKVAVWLFHGDKDKIVPPDFTQQFYKKLKRAGSTVRYSEYEGVEHDSWVHAFAEPELMKWLSAQVKH
jgi:predicted peptidase